MEKKEISPETKLYFFLRSNKVECKEAKQMVSTIKQLIRTEAGKLLK
jgi:hypothetical protein